MVREIAIFKLKPDLHAHALASLEQYAAFKRTQPGCRCASVNPMLRDPSLPYLDKNSALLFAEFDDLKCLAECSRALQQHFQLHQLPFQNFIVGQPTYGIYQE
jgi:hypothetical protein